MSKQKTKTFYYEVLRRECEEAGLVWDEELMRIANFTFHEAGLSQKQVDAVVRLNFVNVKKLFTPQRYQWKARLFVALMFLGILQAPHVK